MIDQAGENLLTIDCEGRYTDEALNNFNVFYNFLIFAYLDTDNGPETVPRMFLSPMVFRTLLDKYATVFMRKVVLLMHSKYGVYFPTNMYNTAGETEHERLRKLLQLPSIDDIFAAHLQSGLEQGILRSVIAGWCKHWTWSFDHSVEEQDPTITLSHPSIFELVGLPLHYDTLVEEAMRRKCPTTGRELQDPVVCLFCGDVVCSQGLCCLDASKSGGANQHMKKYDL